VQDLYVDAVLVPLYQEMVLLCIRSAFSFFFLDPSRCSSGDVRVVDRSGLSLAVFSGIVEVCVNHTYGAISNVSWSYQDARVLCRQQGFSPYGEWQRQWEHF